MRDWLKSLEKLEKRIVSGVEKTWYCAFYYEIELWRESSNPWTKKQGISLKQLSTIFGVGISKLTYIFSLFWSLWDWNCQERAESRLFSRIKTKNDW